MVGVGGIGRIGSFGRTRLRQEAETRELLARFTAPPTAQRKRLINDLIKALKIAGVWAKLDALHIMAAADAQAAQRNWIADAYNLTPVASPTFTADRGYQGDGAASYLGTGFVPSTAGGKFTLNDAPYGVWSLTAAAAANSLYEMGTDFTNRSDLRTYRSDTSNISLALNSGATTVSTAGVSGAGLFIVSRAASSQVKIGRNGAAPTVISLASSALPATEFFVGHVAPAAYGARQTAVSFIGGDLSTAQQAAFYAALNTYLTAVGAV